VTVGMAAVGDRTIRRPSPLPRRSGLVAILAGSSLPAKVLTWLADHLALLLPALPGQGGNPPLAWRSAWAP
jgi:hypothetical protein